MSHSTLISARALRVRKVRVLQLRELRKLHRNGVLRLALQRAGGESLDAEDLVVRQVELAGRRRRPVSAIKLFELTGGLAVWGRSALTSDAQRIRRELAADYTLSDAMPAFVDFPLSRCAGKDAPRERFFALVLIGPRVESG